MKEKICTACGESFVGEGDLCEECLKKQTEATEEHVADVNESTEQTVFQAEEEIPDISEESKFYVDYDEEEEPQKTKNGAKITGLVFGILGSGFGVYYLCELINNIMQQKQMMAQYGMDSPLGIADLIPYIVMGLYFVCGIVGSVLPKNAAKISLVLLMVPASWILFTGVQGIFALIAALGEGQQVAGKYMFIYCAMPFAGILSFVSAILHATYLKYKNN